MLPDRVSNPGPLTYESGALPIALRGPADVFAIFDTNVAHDKTICKEQELQQELKLYIIPPLNKY